jgi:outer membrane immunogenic protein
MYNKAPAYVAPVWSWTGPYVGIVGGGSFGDSTHTPGTNSFSTSGWNVGATLGYNWQIGRFVYGVEGDLSWVDNSGTTAQAAPFAGNATTSEDYNMTLRGRFGWAFTERMMVYGTAGYAGSNVKATVPTLSEEKWRSGWTAGAGVEYALAPQWTVKGEWLYADYGSENYFQGTASARSVDYTTNVFRAGLNYKF